jgi:hypothetical protein
MLFCSSNCNFIQTGKPLHLNIFTDQSPDVLYLQETKIIFKKSVACKTISIDIYLWTGKPSDNTPLLAEFVN